MHWVFVGTRKSRDGEQSEVLHKDQTCYHSYRGVGAEAKAPSHHPNLMR